jgi:hypothetical protein
MKCGSNGTEKPKRKTHLGRPRCRWDDKISFERSFLVAVFRVLAGSVTACCSVLYMLAAATAGGTLGENIPPPHFWHIYTSKLFLRPASPPPQRFHGFHSCLASKNRGYQHPGHKAVAPYSDAVFAIVGKSPNCVGDIRRSCLWA